MSCLDWHNTTRTDGCRLDPSIVAAALTGYAVALSVTINRFGLRRSWRYILTSVVLVISAGMIGTQFFGLDLLPVPLLFSGAVSLLLVQVNSLWSLDRQLTRTSFNTSPGDVDSGTGANARLMSGLKLLNTVLPLNEAVVFHFVDSESSLEAVARFKGPGPTSQDTRRNSVWREGINLCQKAIATGKLESHATPELSTVAVPLRHESETAGVLLIRLASQFSVDDTPLLEAVGSQFARNLKRESFTKNPARTQFVSYFSQSGNKRKLDAFSVLRALTVEQRCEASTLAHIDDGVAIAYLDGTLALVNPTLMNLAGLTSEQVSHLDLFELLNKFRTDIFDEPQIAVRRVLQSGVEYDGELNLEPKSQILNFGSHCFVKTTATNQSALLST